MRISLHEDVVQVRQITTILILKFSKRDPLCQRKRLSRRGRVSPTGFLSFSSKLVGGSGSGSGGSRKEETSRSFPSDLEGSTLASSSGGCFDSRQRGPSHLRGESLYLLKLERPSFLHYEKGNRTVSRPNCSEKGKKVQEVTPFRKGERGSFSPFLSIDQRQMQVAKGGTSSISKGKLITSAPEAREKFLSVAEGKI